MKPNDLQSEFRAAVFYHVTNLFSALCKPKWKNRDIIISACCVVESVAKYLLEAYMQANRVEWPYGQPINTAMLGRLKGAMVSWGIMAEKFTVTTPKDLSILAGIRGQDVAHDSKDIEVDMVLKCVGIALAFLAESKCFENDEMAPLISAALAEARLKSEERESKLSTGAAVEHIGAELIKYISSGNIKTIKDFTDASYKIAEIVRGPMVGFRHFIKVGREYPFSSWNEPVDSKVVVNYIDRFLQYIRECNTVVGREFSHYLENKRNICITEYSRAIFSGLSKRLRARAPLDVYLVDRSINISKAVVPEEVEATRRRLVEEGANVVDIMNLEQWIAFLKKIIRQDIAVDVIAFGAEALTSNGDNVFPQILTDEECRYFIEISKMGKGPQVICVAESYKCLPPGAEHEALAMPSRGQYTIINHAAYSKIISDQGVMELAPDSVAKLQEISEEKAKSVLYSLLKGEKIVPFSIVPTKILKRIKIIAADIDDTMTIASKIPVQIVNIIKRLTENGISTILITGRSSGWCQALMAYLEGLDFCIAENGAVLINSDESILSLYPEGTDLDELKRQIAINAEKVRDEYELEYTSDDSFRIYERTLIRPKVFSVHDIQNCNTIIDDDLELIASSIHMHIRKKGTSKSIALAKVLEKAYGASPEEVLVIGDSATDASLFRDYPISVGVANTLDHEAELGDSLPRFITEKREGHGFIEMVEKVISGHSGSAGRK